jgi:hypothetical protein
MNGDLEKLSIITSNLDAYSQELKILVLKRENRIKRTKEIDLIKLSELKMVLFTDIFFKFKFLF